MAIRYLPASNEEAPPSPQPPALVVFGRSRSGRPRAAWFDAGQAEAATKAAGLMELRILPLAGEEQQAVAAQLVQGHVLSNGKAHVPGARRDLYGRLVAFAGEGAGLSVAEPRKAEQEPEDPAPDVDAVPVTPDEPSPSAERLETADSPSAAGEPVAPIPPEDGPPKPKPGDHNFIGRPIPRERDEIGLGSLVLAHEGPEDGWWEAEIIGMNGRVFSLRWRDYEQPTILRKPDELALLPPSVT